MSRFKRITHIVAAIFLSLAFYLSSPAGQATIRANPAIAPAASAIVALAVYFNPLKKGQ